MDSQRYHLGTEWQRRSQTWSPALQETINMASPRNVSRRVAREKKGKKETAPFHSHGVVPKELDRVVVHFADGRQVRRQCGCGPPIRVIPTLEKTATAPITVRPRGHTPAYTWDRAPAGWWLKSSPHRGKNGFIGPFLFSTDTPKMTLTGAGNRVSVATQGTEGGRRSTAALPARDSPNPPVFTPTFSAFFGKITAHNDRLAVFDRGLSVR